MIRGCLCNCLCEGEDILRRAWKAGFLNGCHFSLLCEKELWFVWRGLKASHGKEAANICGAVQYMAFPVYVCRCAYTAENSWLILIRKHVDLLRRCVASCSFWTWTQSGIMHLQMVEYPWWSCCCGTISRVGISAVAILTSELGGGLLETRNR